MAGMQMKRIMKGSKITRIAVIENHKKAVYIEDVSEETIKEYGGDIDTYVEENYDTSNCMWSVIDSVHLLLTQ